MRAWLIAGGIAAAISVAAFVISLRVRPSLRAALLGSAAGVLFGLAAALTKSTVGAVASICALVVAVSGLFVLLLAQGRRVAERVS